MRNILFLCTANSARSILAEAILDRFGEGRFCAFSAGSKPRSVPNPLALQLLEAKGHDVSQLRSKSWDEFAGERAWPMHAVITVCDNAAAETCPVWPKSEQGLRPVQAHWGIADPAGESDDGELAGFATAYRRLSERIEAMLELDEEKMTEREWRDALMQIGRESEGATGNG